MQNKSEIDQVLRQRTDAGEIPGVVAIAATADDVIYQGAYGKRDLSRDAAMTPDSVL
jgi:methyl acetate hydrolase